jgi:hypothetical protein
MRWVDSLHCGRDGDERGEAALAERQEGENRLEDLANELLARLVELGVPDGTWLLEIDRARQNVHEIDDLLRRLKEAVIRADQGRAQ